MLWLKGKQLRCVHRWICKCLVAHREGLGSCHMLQCGGATGRWHSVKSTSVGRDQHHLREARGISVIPQGHLLPIPADEHAPSLLTHHLAVPIVLAQVHQLLEETLSNSDIIRKVISVHLRSMYQKQCATAGPVIRRGVKWSCNRALKWARPAETEHCTVWRYLGTGKNQELVFIHSSSTRSTGARTAVTLPMT